MDVYRANNLIEEGLVPLGVIGPYLVCGVPADDGDEESRDSVIAIPASTIWTIEFEDDEDFRRFRESFIQGVRTGGLEDV